MVNQNDELLEDENFEEKEIQETKGKKKNLKLILPLILLFGIIGLLGTYYYIRVLVNETNGTPLAIIPEPVDTTITGAENLDQIALADAQLKKQDAEAGLNESPVKDEEVTRVNFSVKDKDKLQMKAVSQPQRIKVIDNVSSPAVGSVKKNNRSSSGNLYNKKNAITTNIEVKKDKINDVSNSDPFNIVIGQKVNKKTVAPIQGTKSENEQNTYNEYIKQYASETQDEEPVPAIISGNQKITPGQTVAIRIKKDMKIKSEIIKSGSMIYGLPTIDNGRINIRVSNVKNGQRLIRTSITVLGEDMNEGVQYAMKGTTDYSNTKGQVVDAATSTLGTVGSIISGLGRNVTKTREPEYWLSDGRKIYLSIN